MRESAMTYHEFCRLLASRYDDGEAKAIARMVLEVAFGLSMTEVMCGAVEQLPADEQQRLRMMADRLLEGQPVQYVIGLADFGPRQFIVSPGVLIPRPETYELCQWVRVESGEKRVESGEWREERSEWREERLLKILDIGTGSGCIACTLAAELPGAQVTAWDISEQALSVARQNAERLQVQVAFEQCDILSVTTEKLSSLHSPLSTFSSPLSTLHSPLSTLHSPLSSHTWDLIVSNPPYICQQEAALMAPHVLEHEPHLALFVPDDDPLLFYHAIARFAAEALKPGGQLFFEVNQLYADETEQMLQSFGFTQTETRCDQFGKPRFVKGKTPKLQKR